MIMTVTLNAAIDKTYHLEQELRGGSVMRVKRVCNTAGGKGLNVARAVRLCGGEAFATGIVGGFNGQYLEQLLQRDGVPHDFFRVTHETRSCINILDEKFASTELLEPGFELTTEEETAFLRHFEGLLSQSDIVTISGSLPRGTTLDLYAKMVETVKQKGKTVILDTSGEALKRGLFAKPTAVKPNREELEALFGVRITTLSHAALYAKRLSDTGIPFVIVSLGKEGALLACNDGVLHAIPPRVKALNTVGCGDTMVGGFALALFQKQTPCDALKYAVSVATASAISEKTGSLDREAQKEIFKSVTVKVVHGKGD